VGPKTRHPTSHPLPIPFRSHHPESSASEHGRRRYAEKLKRNVLAYLAERRTVGRGLKTTSAELVIPERPIKIWSSAPRPSSTPSFGKASPWRPVKMASAGGMLVHLR
jgi:hypothetical protein